MGGGLSVTDEYKTIGHKSIKSTRESSNASIDMNYIILLEDVGKTGVVSFDTYSETNFNTSLLFRKGDGLGSAVVKSSLGVPAGETTHVTFTIPEIQSDTYSVFVRLLNAKDNVYADNFVLKLE